MQVSLYQVLYARHKFKVYQMYNLFDAAMSRYNTHRTKVNTDGNIYEGQHSRFLEGVGGPEVSANGLHEVGVTFGRLRQVARQACQKAHQNRQSSSSSSRR